MATDSVSTAPTDRLLTEIGAALFQLRKVWATPGLMRKLREQTHGERPLQLSNLSVVTAVARLDPEMAGEVTVGAVAERLDVDPSTASRLVGHAIDAGFVSRRPSPVDGRRAHQQLPEAGARVMDVAERVQRGALADLTAAWAPGERREFARLLTRFTTAAARRPMDPSRIDRIFEEAAGAGESP